MKPYLPTGDYDQLNATIVLLLRASYTKDRHLFIHPNSLNGLAEDIAAKYDLEFDIARNFILLLTAKRARVMLDDVL
jgi:hypothetical protein